jgi:hypothetical protein
MRFPPPFFFACSHTLVVDFSISAQVSIFLEHPRLFNAPCCYIVRLKGAFYKPDLDPHLSESDWCGSVVRFWLN